MHDPNSKIFGCVDLLVRSDWLNKLFENCDDLIINKDKIHYVVIDIKFHRIQYNTDGKTIRNEGMIRVFKSQLYIYNKILGYMQDYIPDHAYILGRGWIKTNIERGVTICEKNSNPFNKLGIIDFKGNDSDIVEKSEKAIKWLNELRINNYDDTFRKYDHCYPNMNNNLETIGKKRKRSIAEANNELTLIGYVGVRHRKNALGHGINNYKDNNLTAEKLGVSGKTEKIVNTLIDNQKELNQPIKGEYKCPTKQKVEVFLDFEYLYSYIEDENIPYLCGIGYVNNIENLEESNINIMNSNIVEKIDNTPWNFKHILLDDISIESRKKMTENIMEILKNINATHIYIWSDVDRRLLINLCKKFNLSDVINNIKWIDMYNFCLNNHINFKGAKGYGLKEIGRVLNENKLTEVNWRSNLSSSVGALKHYYQNIKWNPSNLIYYNEIDCKMIYEILLNLRIYEK
jgi:hypothetical protein